MMVAMALTLFIMAILSTAFATGLETFRQLKAIGDMQDMLRTATNVLRSDLAADHFEGKRRLSDVNFWTVGPPREGYLRLIQGVDLVNNVGEGLDGDGIPSRRIVSDILQFTVKRRGNRLAEFFSAPVLDPTSPLLQPALFPEPDGRFQDPVAGLSGTGFFNSQWGEVVYFLSPARDANGNQLFAPGTAALPRVPLYGLYRQVRVVVPDPSGVNYSAKQANAVDVTKLTPLVLASYLNQFSCQPNPANGFTNYLYFNSPSALTIPERRQNTFAPRKDVNGNYTGDDLVMTNVISFDVQLLRSDDQAMTVKFDPDVPVTPLPNLLPPNLTPYFDTWSFIQDEVYDYTNRLATGKPLPFSGAPYTIIGLQITLRVWDSRTQQTRQISIFQEM
jgi:hypothetical protein